VILSQKEETMSTIAIIGSGMGGLVAGNLLAKKGHKVTIFESHVTPGGYTSGFWRKSFYFESGTFSFELSEAVFRVMKDIGVYDKIQFTRQYGRWIFAELDFLAYSFSDVKKTVLEAYPSEKEKLTNYYAEVDRMVKAMLSMRRPSNVFEAIGFPFNLIRITRIFKKYRNTTLPEFTALYIGEDTKPYRFLKNMAYPDMGASIIGAAVLSFFEDYWTVKEGMRSWADALAENFKSLGGVLKLKSQVDEIITKNGTAVGVRSEGNDFEADYVISASDYKKTFLKLLDDKTLIPQELREKIQKAPVSEGFFTVYLGLNLPQEKMKEYLKMPHVFYSDNNPDADIYNSNDDSYFQKAWVMLYSPSLMNPELAPDGKSSLMIQSMAPYKWMNNWGGGGDQVSYKRLKDKAKNALIDKTSAVIPDLREYIEFDEAATPLTYERYTHNTDGATSAWSWNPHKRFYEKVFGINIKTPIRNLYIGSCWANQIGGVPSAINAALECVKKIK
jgi:phytoene dehydrogenase-like protein